MQYLTNVCGAFRADDPANGGRIGLEYRFTGGRYDFVNDIGCVQFTSVDCGTDCACKLNRRHGNALPEADACKIVLGNVFLVSYDAFAFTDKSAARALPKAERIKIIIKLFGTHCQGEFHETAVAGIFRGAGQVLGAVAGMFPAFDAFAVYNITAVAVETVLKMSTSGIECCRKGKDFES